MNNVNIFIIKIGILLTYYNDRIVTEEKVLLPILLIGIYFYIDIMTGIYFSIYDWELKFNVKAI